LNILIPQEYQDLQALVHEVTMDAVKALSPGVPVAEIAKICANGLISRGFDASFECGRMGHGMGLLSTEPSSVTPFDETILQEGMIINLEPGIVKDYGVFDIEENMVITNDGYKILSGGSRKLHHIAD
jgi:Xaa-Pro aminopeptidase